MAAQSTSTLLQVANDVLLGIGERPLINFGSNLGLKVKSVVNTAFYDVIELDDWSWLIDKRNADGWDGNKAIINNRRRLYKVEHRPSPTEAFKSIPYFIPPIFDKYPITGYSDTNTYPLKYTIGSELSVALNPYPVTTDEQVKIWFTAVDAPIPPSTVGGLFPMPERFVELLKKRALYYMAIRHLDDMQLARAFNDEYEVNARRLRDTERSHEVGVLNMFGRR